MKRSAGLSLSSQRGNSVLGSIVSISLASYLTLSVLGLVMSAYNTLLIRDAAIEAAARLALPDSPSQQPFLQRLLDDRLPELADFEIRELESDGLVGYELVARAPLIGFLDIFQTEAEVLVAKEKLF